ncbi:MAG TPA: acyl carrier protein [Terriglobia bacterium]|jgi:acyl carrier protein
METSRGSVQQRIRTIFHDRLQIDAPAAGEDLFQSGILDSLSFVDMLVALEEEFTIQIALDQVDLADFRSIAAISDYIQLSDDSIDKVPLGLHSAV